MAERIPLALLPGLLCDSALWQAQIDGLADVADCRVADFTTQDSIADMTRSVLAMMPERFALAGLSMGGYVAFEAMRQAPERVERLALLDTRAEPDPPERTRLRREMMAQARGGSFKGVTRRLLEQLVHPSRLDDLALTDAVMAMAGRVGRDAFLRQQTAILGRTDSLPTLVAIRCPTLVLCGREDALTPVACHTRIAAGIAAAKLSIIENCGHLSTMERPHEVTAALGSWLQS